MTRRLPTRLLTTTGTVSIRDINPTSAKGADCNMTEQERANVTARKIINMLRTWRVFNCLQVSFGLASSAVFVTLGYSPGHAIGFAVGMAVFGAGLRSAWRFPL
jgi:hypothetical protein